MTSKNVLRDRVGFLALLVIGFFCSSIAVLYGGNGTLQIDKTWFYTGEMIAVHFTADPGFASNAWIGIIPSHVPHGSEAQNDQHDIAYQYLKNMQSGTLTFKAPDKPGSYDFRMHDTDSDGKEVASVTFQVKEAGSPLHLDKTSFFAGENIDVHFTAGPGFASNAWIGIIPSQVPHGSEAQNDQHDIAYQYLKNMQSGTLTFKAPDKPGSYDFRMHDTDSDGKEVASVTFHVKEK